MSMITKQKYIGVCVQDLLKIYIMIIISVLEYCAVAFHSSLTVEQATEIEDPQHVPKEKAILVTLKHCKYMTYRYFMTLQNYSL